MAMTVQNTAAERAVLTALLQDSTLYEAISSRVPSPEVFHNALNREIYAAICRAVEQAGVSVAPYDIYSLAADVENRTNEPSPEGEGAFEYLARLSTGMPVADPLNAVRHMTEAHVRTETGDIIHRATVDLGDPSRDIHEVIATSIEALQDATGNLARESAPVQALAEIADDTVQAILAGSDQTAMPTGYTELDEYIDGLTPGGLYIIGARPSVGKSAMALDIARHLTIREKKNVCFVNLEMRPQDLFIRLLSAEKTIPATQLTRAMKSPEGAPAELAKRVMSAHATLMNEISLSDDPLSPADNDKGNLWVWSPYSDTSKRGSRRTVADVAALLEQMVAAGTVDCLIVDYLQLLEPAVKTESRQNDVASTVRFLKELALRYDIPVLILAQVNRGSTDRADKRPMLSDLRESGEIEQAADVVLLLHNQAKAEGRPQNEALLDVIVAKNRHGSDGTIHLAPELDYCRFSNLDTSALAGMDFEEF